MNTFKSKPLRQIHVPVTRPMARRSVAIGVQQLAQVFLVVTIVTLTLTSCHAFAFHVQTRTPHSIKSIKSTRRSALSLTDPTLITDIIPNIPNMLHSHNDLDLHLNVASTMSTMYTATLPPLPVDNAATAGADNLNNIVTLKDYFIPTTSNEDTIKTLQNYVDAKQAAAITGKTLPNSSDFIKFDNVMPGAKGYINPSPSISGSSIQSQSQYNYQQTIQKQELEWITQQFDIYMRKIPFAVTLYALIDFFVISPSSSSYSSDLLSEELEEDRAGVVMDWIAGATQKLFVLAGIVVAIIFIENLTYHPL